MRRFIALSMLTLVGNFLFSQSVSGTITDGSTLEPVASALVLVMKDGESNPIATAKTNNQGAYSLNVELDKATSYKLNVKMLGYEPYEAKLNSNKKNQKFNIELPRSKNQLKDINVSGTRARAVVRGDTVEYDAKAFKTHKDANVEDLVSKMPGITKEGGEVKAYGEKVQKVLVDGQEFFGEDANIALKNLPAETVDKVEIYDAMSDRNTFTGFNDGNTTKTMNLKTKPGMNKGQFGKAYAGYGTNNRYQGGGNYNYYNGSQRISMLGMVNNINNVNFSTSELVGALTGSSNMGAGGAQMMRGMSFGMSVSGASGRGRGGFGGPMSNFTVSNQDGVNEVASFGLNYNDVWGAKKKVKTSMNYFGNRTDNLAISESIKRNLIDTATTLNSDLNDQSKSTQYKHRFSTRFDGELDSKNSYVWTNKLEIQESNSNNTTTTNNFFTEGISAFKNTNGTMSNSTNTSFNTNFLYKYKFNRTGRTLSLNTILDINKQKGTSTQNIINERGGLTSDFGLDYLTDQWTSTVTNVLTYTEPSGKYGQWLFNYSPSITNRLNDRDVSTFSAAAPSPVIADSLSNHFSNNIFYNVGGISYRLQYSKLRIMFGSSVQGINFEGKQRYPSSSELSKNFFGVLPYFNVQYSPQKMTKLRLQYNTSMNVPSLSYIQPVVDLSNPNMVYKGNESLVNEYSHNMFLHYMKPNIVKGTFFIIVTNLSLTTDKFSNYTYSALNDTILDGVNLRRGMQYTKYVNLASAFNGVFFINYTFPVKALKSNLSTNGSFSYSTTPSVVNNIENSTKTYMYSMGSMLTSNISENLDFSLSYNPKYFLNQFSLPGVSDNNYWIHTVATNLKATFLKNFVWSYDFSYNYNSQIDPSLNQHVFLVGSSLAYKFLANRQMEAKVSIFDIFNQNQNISRSITNTSITDNRTNAMNRYGMFTLMYTFKKFAGKDPDKTGGGVFQLMKPKDD